MVIFTFLLNLIDSDHKFCFEILRIKVTCGFFLFLFSPRELVRYSDSTVPLAETDLDIIAKSKPLISDKEKSALNGSVDERSSGAHLSGDNGINASSTTVEAPVSKSTEAQIALKLGFTLPSSCYATMAIRELLKTSTSVSAAKILTHLFLVYAS